MTFALYILVFFSLLMYGCASSVSNKVVVERLPIENKIQNEIIVNSSFSDVWDILVRELSKSFYVINNIDKESRLINISFSSENPEDYIDCGRVRQIYHVGSEHKEYPYDIASSSNFKTAIRTGDLNQFIAIGDIYRKTQLDGRANIYIAPIDNITQIAVNCKYVLTIAHSGTYVARNSFGVIIESGTIPNLENKTHSFNTNQPNKKDFGKPGHPDVISCSSTGKLESDILSFVKSASK